MSRSRRLLGVSGLFVVLLAVAGAQSAFAAGERPTIVSHTVAALTPSSATIEAAVAPGSSEAEYTVHMRWRPCEFIVTKKDHAGHAECSGKEENQVVGSGMLPAGSEAQTIEVPVALEESQEYLYSLSVKNASGEQFVTEIFRTPGALGTGKPDLMSFTATPAGPRTLQLEAVFDLEGSSGEYSLNECACYKEDSHHHKTLKRASLTEDGTQTVALTVKKLKSGREYFFIFNIANSDGGKSWMLDLFAP